MPTSSKGKGRPKSDTLYDAALAAITRLYSDASVSKDTTRRNLKALRDEIDIRLDTLESTNE